MGSGLNGGVNGLRGQSAEVGARNGYGAADDLDRLFGGARDGGKGVTTSGAGGGQADTGDPFAFMAELGTSSSSSQAQDVSQDAAVEAAKERGNSAFNGCDYAGAVEHYSTCIRLRPEGGSAHVYRSNRAAAYLKLGNASAALADAEECIRLKPDFAKGHARKAAALELLGAAAANPLDMDPPATAVSPADSPADDLEALFGRVGSIPRNASAPEVHGSMFGDVDELGLESVDLGGGGPQGGGEHPPFGGNHQTPADSPPPASVPSPSHQDVIFDGFPLRTSSGGEFAGFTEDGNVEEEDARAAQVAEDARLARAMQRRMNMEEGGGASSPHPTRSTQHFSASSPPVSRSGGDSRQRGTAEKRAKSLYEKALAGAKKYAAMAKKGATELYNEMGDALAAAAASPANQRSQPRPAVKPNAPKRGSSGGKVLPEAGWMRDAAERASGTPPTPGPSSSGSYHAPAPSAEGRRKTSPTPGDRAASPRASISPLVSKADSAPVESPREGPLVVEEVDAADFFATPPEGKAEGKGEVQQPAADIESHPFPVESAADEADLLGGFGDAGGDGAVDNESLLFADDEDFFLEKLAGVSRSQAREDGGGEGGDGIFSSRPDLQGPSTGGARPPAAGRDSRAPGAPPPAAAPLAKVVQEEGESYEAFSGRLRAQRAAEFAARVRAKQQEKVDALRAREEAAQVEQEGKADLQGTAGVKIEAWAKNKEKNVRALLGTLDTVLWEGAAWKKVSMGDLMEASAVHKAFRRANLLVHTDKLSKATPEVRFIGEKLFHILQAAYDDFRSNER